MVKLKSDSLIIKDKIFNWGSRTYIMGILNITPDSFSGDGLENSKHPVESALRKVEAFLKFGVDILDIGGESSRPGSNMISADEELDRVIPIIKAVSANFDVPISIDTYKANVASLAIDSGANIINDIWALKYDSQMAIVASSRNVPIILMHNRSNPKSAEFKKNLGGSYIGAKYDNLIEDIKSDLTASIDLAHKAGIPDQNIILDSGIGFGKSVEQNLQLINQTDKLRSLGYPILIGPSRKSFIGHILNLPPDQRREGTAASISVGITKGADIIRVHDVKTMSRIAQMTDAIIRR